MALNNVMEFPILQMEFGENFFSMVWWAWQIDRYQPNKTLSDKSKMTFSKEYQNDAHRFDALLRAKVIFLSTWVVTFTTKN